MAAMRTFGVFICCFLAFVQSDRQLQLVQTVFRHGDRSPVETFPKDEHKDYWEQGLGQLTMKGMLQHYELGTWMRDRYAINTTFISTNYSRVQVHVRSTDVDRTLMSASCQLAGLFPPDVPLAPTVAWQPIPVHTVTDDTDHLLNPDAPCPKAEQQFDEFLKSPAIQKEEQENKGFYEFIAEQTGMKYENLSDIWVVHDTLLCESQHNRSMLPTWLNDTLWTKLTELSALEFDSRYGTKEQGRLRGGPLVREMLENMERKINDTLDPAERKLFLYSGHDSTVSAFLGALHLFNDIMPPYAATVIVELWQDDNSTLHRSTRDISTPDNSTPDISTSDNSTLDNSTLDNNTRDNSTLDDSTPGDSTPGASTLDDSTLQGNSTQQYYVRILYKNASQPTPFIMPGCAEFCAWETFVSLTRDLVPGDWQKECALDGGDGFWTERHMVVVAVGAGMAVLCLIVIVVFVVARKRMRGGDGGYAINYGLQRDEEA